MKRRRRESEIFSLSFLDVISCGFGAVVLLVLISPFLESEETGGTGDVAALLDQVLDAETRVGALEAAVAREAAALAAARAREGRGEGALAAAQRDLAAAESRSEELGRNVEGLKAVERSLRNPQRASVSADSSDVRDEEVGGIPVDSDFVVFIVDTSGSMQLIWPRVVREVENVIRIHPKIRGFQILNDNGAHLIGAYKGRWIPDTPRWRENAVKLFRTWQSASNSSPVEGLEVALRRYVKPKQKVSVYIFGDDYTGSSYDPVIRTLSSLNTDRITGATRARIHAVGFLSAQTQGRFEVLMREVTRRNDGTFVALPP